MSVHNAWLRFLAWLRGGRVAPPASEKSDPEAYGPELPPDWTPPAVKKPRAEPYKALSLRRDILEQLDKYQVYVKRIAPIASLNTALELLVSCELAWLKMLKKHEYDQLVDL